MPRQRPTSARTRSAALLALVLVAAAACGGSGSTTPATPGLDATTTAPITTPDGGDGGQATPEAVATDDGSGGDGTDGGRRVSKAPGYDGQITFNGVFHSSSSYDDTVKVTANLVLRQNGNKDLVYAKGSKVNVSWSTTLPDDYCPTSAEWSGPLSSLNGEALDDLSDPHPVAWGQVATAVGPEAGDAEFLWLDIYVASYETAGDKGCSTMDFAANCPNSGHPSAQDAWVPKASEPRFQLTWNCTEKRQDASYGYEVQGTGTLDEIAPAGG